MPQDLVESGEVDTLITRCLSNNYDPGALVHGIVNSANCPIRFQLFKVYVELDHGEGSKYVGEYLVITPESWLQADDIFIFKFAKPLKKILAHRRVLPFLPLHRFTHGVNETDDTQVLNGWEA